MSKREKLREKAYRESYGDSFLDSLIATQIRVLREQRKLNQKQLGDLAGMKQSRISTMENVNYCSWSVATLKRLAHAFDVPLIVRFESFGSLLGDEARLTADNLKRPSFDQDYVFYDATRRIDDDENCVANPKLGGQETFRTFSIVIDAADRFGIRNQNVA